MSFTWSFDKTFFFLAFEGSLGVWFFALVYMFGMCAHFLVRRWLIYDTHTNTYNVPIGIPPISVFVYVICKAKRYKYKCMRHF